MLEWPTVGALLAVALPIAIIFLVLGVFRIVQRRAEDAVRSPEYWDEVPDGKRYPTGWGPQTPEAGEPTEPGTGENEPGSVDPHAADRGEPER